MTIRIRTARKDEARALTELSRRSKAYWGYDNAFLEACADELYIGPAALDDMNQTWRVATEADSIAGVYGLAPVNAETVELAALFVEPGAIGKGIGRRLVDDALHRAQADGFQRMLIQGDPNAEGFYKAMGARRTGERESGSIRGRFLPLFELEIPTST